MTIDAGFNVKEIPNKPNVDLRFFEIAASE